MRSRGLASHLSGHPRRPVGIGTYPLGIPPRPPRADAASGGLPGFVGPVPPPLVIRARESSIVSAARRPAAAKVARVYQELTRIGKSASGHAAGLMPILADVT